MEVSLWKILLLAKEMLLNQGMKLTGFEKMILTTRVMQSAVSNQYSGTVTYSRRVGCSSFLTLIMLQLQMRALMRVRI